MVSPSCVACQRLANIASHLLASPPVPHKDFHSIDWKSLVGHATEDHPRQAGSAFVRSHAASGDVTTSRVSRSSWGEVDRSPVELVTLRNGAGVEASILTYGCVLQSMLLPAGGGEKVDVVLGYDTLAQYVNGKSNFGSIVGRYANRIPDGQFTVQGQEYLLPPNAGPTALHGGAEGLYTRVFTVSSLSECGDSATAEFTYVSPSGEAGYPGELSVRFTCSLNDANELRMEYRATADEPTIVSLTNHSYWNLNGHGGSSIMDQELTLNCSTYTPTDPNNQSVPTGELAPVEGTAFEFRPGKGGGSPGVTIGSRTSQLEMKALGADGSMNTSVGGLDHSFCIDNPQQRLPSRDPAIMAMTANMMPPMSKAARLHDPVSDRAMEIFTTAPAIQVHTANNIDGEVPLWFGKGGVRYQKQGAINLETQNLPNAVNTAHFPSPVLMPGEKYVHIAVHRFTF